MPVILVSLSASKIIFFILVVECYKSKDDKGAEKEPSLFSFMFMPLDSRMHGLTTRVYKVCDEFEYYPGSCFLAKSFVRMVDQFF